MTTRRVVLSRAPPRVVYLAVWECGTVRMARTQDGARSLIRIAGSTCCPDCPVGGHAVQIIPYRRASPIRRGALVWTPRVIEGGKS